jgi:transposase-like protein
MEHMRKSRLSQYKARPLLENFVAETTTRCAASLIGENFKTGAYKKPLHNSKRFVHPTLP